MHELVLTVNVTAAAVTDCSVDPRRSTAGPIIPTVSPCRLGLAKSQFDSRVNRCHKDDNLLVRVISVPHTFGLMRRRPKFWLAKVNQRTDVKTNFGLVRQVAWSPKGAICIRARSRQNRCKSLVFCCRSVLLIGKRSK